MKCEGEGDCVEVVVVSLEAFAGKDGPPELALAEEVVGEDFRRN